MKQAQTSVKVATITGAAKDDLFNGIVSEDSGGHTLDVLSNDPGAAKLYSVAQNPGLLAGTAQFPIVTSASTANGATVSIVGSELVYNAGSAFQSLGEGVVGYDTFVYTVRMANGALSTATATVQVTGVNDLASISGDDAGSVAEDATLEASGTLSVSDLDLNEDGFAAVDPSDLAGTYGDFTFDGGAWTYMLRNADANVQALISGQQVTDSLVVASLDGTATQTITVTINGADEPAVTPDPEPEVNPAVRYMVNHGLTTINGRYVITGFDGNDILKHAASQVYVGSELFDYDGDATADSTLVTFTFQLQPVEVVLVGYTEFTAAQLD